MTEEGSRKNRRYARMSLPKGMWVAWYGDGQHQVSRVETLGLGGLFISTPNPPPVGANVRLAFEVPGGEVRAEALVRNVAAGEGMGVEFTRMDSRDRVLLGQLMRRLLR